MSNLFANRDISWLSFNGRVLDEAARPTVPLLERFRFLSIFSSNLDEFYRVRMSPLLLLRKLNPASTEEQGLTEQVQNLVREQQEKFGRILRQHLLPSLQSCRIHLLYDEPVPAAIEAALKSYFQSTIMAFLQIIYPGREQVSFFPKSNQLYIAVIIENKEGRYEIVLLSVPSDKISRFFTVSCDNIQYIVFLDDIIKKYLSGLFPQTTVKAACNIKITRDAELDLADEYEGDLAEKIEKQLAGRDNGYATRFLYEPGFPVQQLYALVSLLKLSGATLTEGGRYHNLKDFGNLPVQNDALNYPPAQPVQPGFQQADAIFAALQNADRIIHTPYHSYDAVLRFFNEAATDLFVEEIYVTLYRVAGNSRIVNALITAAENGKQVTVFIELKARFDEENNIRWSKKMKAAGVRIINSIPGLKVHAKVALVKKKQDNRSQYYGLLATGNLNEITARFYTDHILLTAHPDIVRELELLFIFLTRRRKPTDSKEIKFRHLLVAQFNLHNRFLELIDREISHVKAGKPAGIIIKLNNLEEQSLISKLYEASCAGVNIRLIVRSICCLQPGIAGMSERITVTRIVDRYLEHGRVFIFDNAGDEEIWIGSADWMNRNIYRRIEVCFPLYDLSVKKELRQIIELQLRDNVQAVEINPAMNNQAVQINEAPVQSQQAIYQLLKKTGQPQI